MPEKTQVSSELKARAVFDAYTTLRAVEFALRKIQPLVAAHCEESRDLLAEAFPELRRVERVLQFTEEEIKTGGSHERPRHASTENI